MAALASADEIVEAGRRCSLTKAVLRRWAESGTPRQRDYLLGYLLAEGESRDASKRAQLLRRCALPQAKTLEGYDWSCVSWPEGLGRGDLESLSFVEAREDLVLMGDVGTGKTHMACALAAACCARGWEARFFTASSLVLRLRRARDDGRLDRELSQIGRARLLVVDELGFLPLDADGARLLFQVVSEAYERQSVVFTTNLEFSMWGQTFGDEQMAAAVIDRVVHHGRLLRFRGESYRVRNALMGGKGGWALRLGEEVRRLGAAGLERAERAVHPLRAGGVERRGLRGGGDVDDLLGELGLLGGERVHVCELVGGDAAVLADVLDEAEDILGGAGRRGIVAVRVGADGVDDDLSGRAAGDEAGDGVHGLGDGGAEGDDGAGELLLRIGHGVLLLRGVHVDRTRI